MAYVVWNCSDFLDYRWDYLGIFSGIFGLFGISETLLGCLGSLVDF